MNFKFDSNDIMSEKLNSQIGFRQLLDKYKPHIKWFVISVIIFMIAAFFKVRYEVPLYNISASLLIKKQEKGESIIDLSELDNLGLFGSSSGELENEIFILGSRKIVSQVITDLGLNFRYSLEDDPINMEYFPSAPFSVDIEADSSIIYSLNTDFEVEFKSKNSFEIFDFDGNSYGVKKFDEKFEFNLGNKDKGAKKFVISLKKESEEVLVERKVLVNIYSLASLIEFYTNRLELIPLDAQLSNIIVLNMKESNVARGRAFLQNLIQQYNYDGIKSKDLIAEKTSEFLNERVELISSQLTAIESVAAKFKTSTGLTNNAQAASEVYLQNSNLAENEFLTAKTQLELVNFMISDLSTNDFGQLLPVNVGLNDAAINTMIGEYNSLVLRRNRILTSSSSKNPIIQSIDDQLRVLKSNLNSSLNGLSSSYRIQIDALDQKRGRINSKIASAPKYEMEYKDIVREQETKNALYLFLLQKREESILSNAVKIEKAAVIDQPHSNYVPASPNIIVNFGLFFVIGLVLPFSVFYLRDLLDTKIHSEKDLTPLNIPILGQVPHSKKVSELDVYKSDNGNVAEAFRFIRTNLRFMLDGKNGTKTIFVTSTIGHEGKSISAINLSKSLALSGSRTLLIGMDLRAPKLKSYLKVKGFKIQGVTNYVSDSRLEVEDIIQSHEEIKNLFFINSGDIPPNPVEMLMSVRISHLFEEVIGNFDYIIVDTAPMALVADTMQIKNYSDLTLYVVRANFLDKQMLHIPYKLNQDHQLNKMAFILNDVVMFNNNYGYGYGYGHKPEKKSFWSFL